MSRTAFFAAVVFACNCGFFRELESLPGAEGTSTGDSSDAGDTGPCAEAPDSCLDQDRIMLCDPSSGEYQTIDCVQLCGEYLNVSCVALTDVRRACWCAEPGKQKVLSCGELETCLLECGDSTGDCALACFRRTTGETARLLGALMYCAEKTCRSTCHSDAAACNTCMTAARAGHYDCGVARGLCDQDKNDEGWPP